MPNLPKLTALQHDANEALKRLTELLQKHPKQLYEMGAVNWASLHATAYQVTDMSGDIWYRVEIEEAAPESVGLQTAVHAALLARGWPESLEVVTEW